MRASLFIMSFLVTGLSALPAAPAGHPATAAAKAKPKVAAPTRRCFGCEFKCPITIQGKQADVVLFNEKNFGDILDKMIKDPKCQLGTVCTVAGSPQKGIFLQGISFELAALVLHNVDDNSYPILGQRLRVVVPGTNSKTSEKLASPVKFDCDPVS